MCGGRVLIAPQTGKEKLIAMTATGSKKRARGAATVVPSVFVKHAGTIGGETFPRNGDNLCIELGDGKLLELGMNHWEQQEWCSIGFQGSQSWWNEKVERVTVQLTVVTCDKPPYTPYALDGMDLSQTFAFNPTHPSLKWDDGNLFCRKHPGFAFPAPAWKGDWDVEVTIELKSA